MTVRRAPIALAGALLAGPALAGGFSPAAVTTPPSAPVAVAPAAPAWDWTGLYLGGQFGRGRLETTRVSTDELAYDGEGTLLGLHAGYMRDLGRVVLGAELDWDRATIDFLDTEEVEPLTTVDSLARAKLRLGFDAGRLLPYVTAGLARLELGEEIEDSDGTSSGDGRFLGLGVAFAASDRLTLGVEALRHGFPETPVFDGLADWDTTVDTVTLRASFSF